jgi:predicted house-cleaning noncanonical NTP pyrophosphatase (MazG superfamily)
MNMKRFKIEKLVRDRIPQILESYGVEVFQRILDNNEYIECLKNKLIEEAHEVLAAAKPEDMKEELADVFEVLIALGAVFDISLAEIEEARVRKKMERGGFNQRIYTSCAEIDAANPRIKFYLSQPDRFPEITRDIP